MLSFDTNLAVHAANHDSEWHKPCRAFIASLATRRDVAICELMLVELYLKLRNARIFPKPLSAAQATTVCTAYRSNQAWQLIDCAPVMDDVWNHAAKPGFAFRRIIDVRLARTLLHHGVTEFATANTKDFLRLGFDRVWNPLVEG
ncbi:PIN domain-containing protein [bacterium]|nr:PIN domain-containing protein [bacterium]